MAGAHETVQPRVLLLASRYDVTCDFIVAQLRRRSVEYLRLNSEDLCDLAVELDPVRRRLVVRSKEMRYVITPEYLRSVLFRRPVYLRDYGEDDRSPEEQFSRVQWTAFMSNLMLFHEARWMNHPVATYRAEHKAVQLSVAARLGFAVPETRVTNAPHPRVLGNVPGQVAVKGLDTVLWRSEGQEMFGFTTFDQAEALTPAPWRSAPATIQAALTSKLDVRVTVVEDQVLAAEITLDGKPVDGDWRTRKGAGATRFAKHSLPDKVAQRCRQLVRSLDLRFGGIDLAYQGGEYYFIEINPTGEWAWLVSSAGLPIDEVIGAALARDA